MNWKPNRWIAGILTLLVLPIGYLYIARARTSLILFVFNIGLIFIGQFYMPDWFLFVIWFIYLIFAIYVFNVSKKIVLKRPLYSRWYGMIAVVMIVMLPLFAVRVFYFEPFRLPSSAMSSTLNVGDYFAFNRNGCGNYKLYGISIYKTKLHDKCQINRDDIIVFEYSNDHNVDYIKRVVGISGDIVSYNIF